MITEAGDPGGATGATASVDYCTGCGSPGQRCGGCRRLLDPPRFCPACGRRLTVAVTPAGYRARCGDHGVILTP